MTSSQKVLHLLSNELENNLDLLEKSAVSWIKEKKIWISISNVDRHSTQYRAVFLKKIKIFSYINKIILLSEILTIEGCGIIFLEH